LLVIAVYYFFEKTLAIGVIFVSDGLFAIFDFVLNLRYVNNEKYFVSIYMIFFVF